ncbi:MAG: hypothetical protein ACLPND_07640, partial [Candidatus Korobacteraceae bacterium]
MKHSSLFTARVNLTIEASARDFLNGRQQDFPSSALKSPRAVGDIAQVLVSDNFDKIVPPGLISNYSSTFARRAMADLAFEDSEKHYYIVDVKTHMRSSKFNMPNLTSVERLARFYEDDNNYFVVMMMAYDVSPSGVNFDHVNFVPIEFLSWNCLTLGALGWGQIQIANSNIVEINPLFSRRSWMIEMC